MVRNSSHIQRAIVKYKVATNEHTKSTSIRVGEIQRNRRENSSFNINRRSRSAISPISLYRLRLTNEELEGNSNFTSKVISSQYKVAAIRLEVKCFCRAISCISHIARVENRILIIVTIITIPTISLIDTHHMKVNVSTTTLIIIPANRRRECLVFRSIDLSTIRNSTKELLFSSRCRIGDVIRDIKNLTLENIIGFCTYSISNDPTNTERTTKFTTFLNMNLAITNIESTNIVFPIHPRAIIIKVIKLDEIAHGSILEQILTLSNTTLIIELAKVLNSHIAQRLMISLCQTTNMIYQRLTTLFLLESKEERLETMENLRAFNHICLRQQIIGHITIILNRTLERTDSTIILDNKSSTS